jgi:hypothetical protein
LKLTGENLLGPLALDARRVLADVGF